MRSRPARGHRAARQEGNTLVVPVLEEVLIVEERLPIKEEIHDTRTGRRQRSHINERRTAPCNTH